MTDNQPIDVKRLAAVLRGMGIVEFDRADEFAELIAARYEGRPVARPPAPSSEKEGPA